MPYKRRHPTWRRSRTSPRKARRTTKGRVSSSRRTRYRRGYKGRRGRIGILKTIAPNVAYVKLRCGDTWALSGTTPGTSNWLRLHANNAYDPVSGASTAKCSGYDQIMAMYKYLQVQAVKIRVGFVQTTAAASEVYGYIQFEPSSGNYNRVLTADELNESLVPFTRKRIITSPSYYNQRQPVWIKNYISIKRLEHKGFLEPANYRQTLSGGPTVNSYMNVGYQQCDSSGTVGSAIRALVRITYYCKVYERLPLGA